MSDTTQITGQAQDKTIWEGLTEFKRLPEWLADARNPTLILKELGSILPESQTGRLRLVDCDPGGLRFKTDFWTGQYEITVSAQGEEEPRKVVLAGKIYSPNSYPDQPSTIEGEFGAGNFRVFLSNLHLELSAEEPETTLEALSMLADPELSREFLTKSIQAGSPRYRDLTIQASHPKVVRYKPGSRCTIVYHLEFPEDQPGKRHLAGPGSCQDLPWRKRSECL